MVSKTLRPECERRAYRTPRPFTTRNVVATGSRHWARHRSGTTEPIADGLFCGLGNQVDLRGLLGGSEGIRTDGHRGRRDPTKSGIYARADSCLHPRKSGTEQRRHVFFDHGNYRVAGHVLPAGEALYMRYAGRRFQRDRARDGIPSSQSPPQGRARLRRSPPTPCVRATPPVPARRPEGPDPGEPAS
jgi:hypothetical protein